MFGRLHTGHMVNAPALRFLNLATF